VATHDYVISNGTGSAVRSDINGALAAIVSQNSNASAPATTYAYMSWADTSAGVMKMRNGANSAWISLYELDGTFLASDISLAAGSAAAPSLFFTGDTNTGLFSPGADTVALATAGSNRLHISSGGLVGIGTTGPANALQVVSGSNYVASFNTSTISASSSAVVIGNYLNNGGGASGGAIRVYHNHGAGTATSMAFEVNGATEAIRIDDQRRLLVGTSSARANFFNSGLSAALQLEGTGNARRMSILGNDAQPIVILAREKSGSVGGNTVVANGDVLGLVSFQGSDGTDFVSGAEIYCEVDGTPGANDMPGRLVFSTTADGASSPTERVRITNGGSVLIGNDNTSNNGKLYVNQNTETNTAKLWDTNASTTSDGVLAVIASRNTTNNTFYAISYYNVGTGTYRFRVADSGNCTNTNNSYGAISDLKLKENIVDANSQWDDLKALQVRNYNFKEGQTHTQIGLVAQEAELVSPGLVSESPDRDEEGNDLGTVTKSVNYSVLYMKAVKALQEAMERIEALETRLSALEAA
jgi:hypothetical protein